MVLRAPSVATETGFGISNAVHSGVVAHYVLAYGSAEQRQRQRRLPGVADGSVVGAIAMTEPGAGSDLQRLRTTAIRDGDHYTQDTAELYFSDTRVRATDLLGGRRRGFRLRDDPVDARTAAARRQRGRRRRGGPRRNRALHQGASSTRYPYGGANEIMKELIARSL